MKLYLVQHGEAASKEADPERPLTGKGRKDSAKTAEFLGSSGISVDSIWHSTKTRAMETARIFENELSPKEGTVQKEGLAPSDPVTDILAVVMAEGKDIMIVGHLPFLEKIASYALIGAEEPGIVKFNMGGVVCLERDEDDSWQLLFAVKPDLL